MWDGDPEGKIGAAALRITPAGHILGIVGEHLILEHALAILYLALARSGLISADELTKLEVDGNLTYMVLRARD
ncbi:MAG: hypothetical protein H6760_03585 [Candidatus Nomurabacteria bacterium]|nr:MAG: hypothetical protein H6760_03585 [Candidatus Nomurabacteria bacterium]